MHIWGYAIPSFLFLKTSVDLILSLPLDHEGYAVLSDSDTIV